MEEACAAAAQGEVVEAAVQDRLDVDGVSQDVALADDVDADCECVAQILRLIF